MLSRIAKLYAYAKSPTKTFVALHPVKAAKMYLAYKIVQKARS